MKHCIPGELWNQIGVPSGDADLVNASSCLSEMAYKMPAITDVMIVKEFWHTVCELAERCGALRERVTASVSYSAPYISSSSATLGAFQRFVGAGIGGVQTNEVRVYDSSSGPVINFNSVREDGSSVAAYADMSVVPDIKAAPVNQNVPSWFMKKYSRALMSGTLMRIYAMPGEAWTDEAGARMNATTYFREINRISFGLVTSGMRKSMLVDAESILARQSQTSTTNSTTNTVG